MRARVITAYDAAGLQDELDRWLTAQPNIIVAAAVQSIGEIAGRRAIILTVFYTEGPVPTAPDA